MNKYSKEIKVGIFTVVVIVMFIIGMNYLKGTSFFQTRIYLNAKYKQINGLMVGGKVMYNGLQLGQVRSIYVEPQTKDIIVSFDIAHVFDIPKNSTAMIYSIDFLGTKGIQLLLGSGEPCAAGDTLRDSLEVGMVDKAMTEIEPIKVKLETTLTEVNLLAKSIRNVIEDSTNYRIQTMLAHFQKTTYHLSQSTQKLPQLLAKFDTIASNTSTITGTLANEKENIQKIVHNAKLLSDSLAAGAGDIKQLMQNAQKTLAELQGIIKTINNGEGTIGKLLKGEELHQSMVKTTESLNALLVEFKEHPKRFVHFSLFGKKDKPQNSLSNTSQKK